MPNVRRQHADGFRPRLIALSVAACFSVSAQQALANPTGGSVVSGSASFANSGSTLTITNSAGAIINWQSFSIGINEITRFLQTSSSSAVLNRVVGAGGVIPQSVIDGVLSSNGRVFLLNSSGIVFGASARIDVAGLVASSLNLSDQDFLNGRMHFTEVPGAGDISNAGMIQAASGGRVFLVAPNVKNSGAISAPQGQIVLAAGKSVDLVSENSPFVTVRVTADTEQALNLGSLIAESGRIDMSGALVRQSGLISANSASVGANGEIRLVSTRDLTLDAGSSTTANGPSGGSVLLQAQGGTNLVYGNVQATGSSGAGGTIQALGVRVGVVGNGVIDASGESGGGTVLVGGDLHGANPDIQNAERTLIGPDGVIRADARTTGDGGRVIVWADGDTRFYGSISAQGGAQSGNGGFVETSGKQGLDIQGGRVDTRAANGVWGTWLLDPTNVYLEVDAYVGIPDPVTSAATFDTIPGLDAHIIERDVEAAFNTNGTVRLQATNDVNFNTNLTLSYGQVGAGLFEVRAQHDINLAANTISTNGQDVVLSANDVGVLSLVPALNTVGTGSITGSGTIIANAGTAVGGNITLSGYRVSVGNLQTAGGLGRQGANTGDVNITALAGGVQTGSITTRGGNGTDFSGVTAPTAGSNGGNVNISAAYGTVITGDIDTGGGRGGSGGYGNGQFYGAQAGGSGGSVTISGDIYGGPATSITTGSITTAGGAGGAGGTGGSITATTDVLAIGRGGNGGVGGSVSLTGGDVTTLALNLLGGAGGVGADGITATLNGVPTIIFAGSGDLRVGEGGFGGSGGAATINGNNLSIGSIATSGGAGGAGGSGNTAITIVNAGVAQIASAFSTAIAGSGGGGGAGGAVNVNGAGTVTVGAITSAGAAGGAGGANNTASASVDGALLASNVIADAQSGHGGDGNSGNQVRIAGGGAVTTGTITTGSGAGGAGGNASNATAYASSAILISVSQASANSGSGGDAGFSSGDVTLGGSSIATGAIAAIDAAGGGGGAGSTATASGLGASFFPSVKIAPNGAGGFGGNVVLGGALGVTTGTIDTSGFGAGFVSIDATTGDIVTGSITTRSLSPAFAGGIVALTTDTGRIVVNGSIDARGSDGLGILVDTCGDSCIGFAYGGSAGGTIALTRTGAGDPAGGTAVQVNGSILASGGNGFSPVNAAGGNGGAGGQVLVSSQSQSGTFYGAVNVTGVIDAHGGSGGNGAAGFGGGTGGAGVLVQLAADRISSGAINAAGGAGGSAGTGSVGNGGSGGAGGFVSLFAPANIAVGNIAAAGGAGGNGASTGTSGNGGVGGSVIVDSINGAIDMTTGGFISVAGGNGGAGGLGGTGGSVDIFAPLGISLVGALNIDGVIITGPVTIPGSPAIGGTGGLGTITVGGGNIVSGSVDLAQLPDLTQPNNSAIDQLNRILYQSTVGGGEPKKDKDGKGPVACK